MSLSFGIGTAAVGGGVLSQVVGRGATVQARVEGGHTRRQVIGSGSGGGRPGNAGTVQRGHQNAGRRH